MPIFQYKCPDCNHVQDEFHSINSKSPISCQKCEKNSERQFVPTSNFVLKGSGWPGQEVKMKASMGRKNTRMKGIMKDRDKAGESVSKISDLKRVQN